MNHMSHIYDIEIYCMTYCIILYQTSSCVLHEAIEEFLATAVNI